MKALSACILTVCLLCPLVASAELSGAYVSQFAADDPQAAAGGTQPVFVVVVEKGAATLATVNASYTHPSAGWTSQVWSYAIFDTSSLQSGTTVNIVDSFGVCDNTVRVTAASGGNLVMESLATAQKAGVANPLNIDCADIYPVPLTRTFTPVF
jgi:hypothetical protein